uniref:Uncharacterized protein n=1 Tax=Anopheles minimus TaxID=112268 RepID=A0A182WMX6_9DIPT
MANERNVHRKPYKPRCFLSTSIGLNKSIQKPCFAQSRRFNKNTLVSYVGCVIAPQSHTSTLVLCA